MEWIKRNLGFVVVGAASLLLLGVATWFLFAQMGSNAAADQTLTDLLDKRTQLWSAPVHPIGKGEVKNIEEVRKDRVRLGAFLKDINAVIPVFSANFGLDDQGFKSVLEKTIFQLGRTATNGGVAVPADYAFSFAPIRGRFRFNSNSINPLVLQLGDVQALTSILIDSHVNTIDGIRRSPMTVDDQESASSADFLGLQVKTNEFTITMPYELTFQAFTGDVAEIVNRMMKSDRCIVVKSIEVAPAGGAGMIGGYGEGRPAGGFPERGPNPYSGLRPGAGRGGSSYTPMQQPQYGANPLQPTVVLESQPLRIMMLVDIVRLVGTNTR
jgi:hypothetical protein